MFQTDSLICTKYKHLINNFLKYDYVGAPYALHMVWGQEANYVGNGGLSLRKKSVMLVIINSCKDYNPGLDEDLYFSAGCVHHRTYKPHFVEAREFSIETVYSSYSFGVHAPWKWLPKESILQINKECANVDDLRKLYTE